MKRCIVFFILIPCVLRAQNNIGIGIASPGAKLHVVSNTSEVIRVEAFFPIISFNTNGTQRGFIGNTSYGIEISSAPGYSGAITLSPEGIPIMKVNPGGLVRIEGSTAPGGVGFSMGGYGEFQVDKFGMVSGRFIIKEDGKVGIGKTDPAEILDVAGTIRATAYKFENPKTYNYAIHPSAFVARLSPIDIRYDFGVFLNVSANYSDLWAPINLPDNAIIKRVRIELHDSSPTLDVFFNITKSLPGGSGSALNSMSSSGSAGNATIDSGPLSILINNTNGPYSITAFTFNIWPGNALIVRAVYIEYTINEL